jgi:predicted ATPase
LRVKGEVVLRADAPGAGAAAEASFLRSLEIAGQQGALSWELRTATSLACLWQEQGRIAEGHDLLATTVDRFREGFETADLLKAKTLLAVLADTSGR